MFFNRRKLIAGCLLILAVAAWILGGSCLGYQETAQPPEIDHTLPHATSLLPHATSLLDGWTDSATVPEGNPPSGQQAPGSQRLVHILGWCLWGASAVLAAGGIYWLWQGAPLVACSFWILLPLAALLWSGWRFSFRSTWPVTAVMGICALLGLVRLWLYEAQLKHLLDQIGNLQKNLPVVPKRGTFFQTEAQLAALGAQQEEAVRTAVRSERFKVELIANVSHDLRTPLTAILGYGELLEKEALSPEGEQQLARLNQKAGYMRELVESLFELTKVSSGVAQAQKTPIDLIRLLEQTVGLLDDRIAAARLQIRRHYPAQSVPLVTDGARMHQVFMNLLGNAVKYALPGTRIHLEVKEDGQSCTVRLVNIASYEMDFQPEEILQRFARADKARTTQGSGIGLAIAQTYTQSVGGSFQVEIDGEQFIATVVLPKN